MALFILQPGIQPLGQFDFLDTDLANVLGGEIGAWAEASRTNSSTEKAAQDLGLPYDLEKVTDLKLIMAFGVMMTPALVVDGKVKLSGKVPGVAELKAILQPAAGAAQPQGSP